MTVLILPVATQAQSGSASVASVVQLDESRTVYATSWQPDLNPVNGFHLSAGSWRLMLHGRVFAGYVREETPRGGSQWGSANWAMLAAARQLGRGRLTLSATTSLETLTLGDCGYPRLLAGSGCNSDGFGEYQHPHGIFPELSARYTHPLSDSVALLVYAAAAGEPALGPVAYHHRVSAAADPVAPMSQHELNPAHSAGGVLTAGFVGTAWKLEVSAFNGEPVNTNRTLPELGPLESVSFRMTVNPSPNWSFQGSAGNLKSVAAHHEGNTGDMRVLSASVMLHAPSSGSVRATTLAFTHVEDGTLPRNALLVESVLPLGRLHSIFARVEAAHRLDEKVTIIVQPDSSHAHFSEFTRHRAAQISAGYLLSHTSRIAEIGIGARASVSFIPDALVRLYEERRPWGFAIFARVEPPLPGLHPHR
jgi:hypothetical protein